MYIMGMIILVIFAVIGLCAFLSAIIDFCCCKCRGMTIVLDDLEIDSAEARLRKAARMYKENCDSRLLVVCDKGEPAYDICELMKKEYPFLELISPEDIKIP